MISILRNIARVVSIKLNCRNSKVRFNIFEVMYAIGKFLLIKIRIYFSYVARLLKKRN